MRILNEESRYIHKNLEEKNLFVRIDKYDSDNDEDE